jgi:hypothetical protein
MLLFAHFILENKATIFLKSSQKGVIGGDSAGPENSGFRGRVKKA